MLSDRLLELSLYCKLTPPRLAKDWLFGVVGAYLKTFLPP